MNKTSLLALGLATALGLGAAAPAMARDHHEDRWNNNAGAAFATPGATTGWYGGPNPNWRPPQVTYNGETHNLKDDNGYTYYESPSGNRISADRVYSYPYGYYYGDNRAALDAWLNGYRRR